LVARFYLQTSINLLEYIVEVCLYLLRLDKYIYGKKEQKVNASYAYLHIGSKFCKYTVM